MFRRSCLLSGAALFVLVATSASASAQSVSLTDLFPTGVDAFGNRLAGGALDPHYSIVSLAGTPPAVVIGSGTSASDCRGAASWLVPGGQSCWVWQTAAGTPTGTVASPYTLTFRTTFDLTGFNAGTAFIGGSWSTDNAGLDILINGTSTGQTSPSFSTATNFSVSSGFTSGLNTLDLVVRDFGVVSGFLVQSIEGRAERLASVPEPSSVLLIVSGLALLAGARRRRRSVM